jgi:translation initiation factor IF-2
MNDNKDSDGKNTGGSHTITLKTKRTVEAGHVRQNVSQGRKNTVVVQRRKKRIITKPGAKPQTPPSAPGSGSGGKSVGEKKTGALASGPGRGANGRAQTGGGARKSARTRRQGPGGKLSSSEMDARQRALEAARQREVIEAEERKKAELERQERDRLAAEERERKAREEAENAARENAGETKSATRPAAGERAPAKTVAKKKDAPAPQPVDRSEKRGDAPARKSPAPTRPGPRPRPETPTPSRMRGGGQKRHRKLTIQNALDEGGRQRSLASLRRQQQKQRRAANAPRGPVEKISREVILPEAITIQELAVRMAERAVDVIKFLMKQGQMHKINDIIDADTAELIAEEFGHTVKRVSEADVEEGFIGEEDREEDLEPRAPVVTIMGHVDHGKTSLLDAIREANVVSGEAGGITQHIGAYQVDRGESGKVTFIDTPGHAAFTEMRARGARVTDIVVLVVAANDGVMPQTIEAINHARAAEVPIIVAINKIDLPEADPNRVRTELLQHEIVVESMGGDVLEVEVSALRKTNLDGLLEAILMQSEILELKANPNRKAEGFVIEAQLEHGRGAVATLLVQRGTLKVGNIVVAGSSWGRVRALINDHGEHVVEAGPAMPIEVMGLNSAPSAGDQFAVVENEQKAREITEYRERKRRELLSVGTGGRSSLEQMMSQLKEAGKKEFPLIIKGDVQGSIEAIAGALDKLGNEEVTARIVHSAVGGISESDITLANASRAVIVGFNVRANIQAREAAEREGVEIRYYSVIYDLVDDVKAAMSGLLSPEKREHFLGNAEILEVFNITKVGKVAGCRVTEGKVERGAGVRLIRDNVVIHEGRLSTLKRFKDEVKEVAAGQECGMAFENYQDIRPGDVIEAFLVEMVQRQLD